MKIALLIFAAFAGGVLISFLNFLMMSAAAKSDDKRMMAVSPVRSILSAAYLFLLFFISTKVKVSTAALLIGGAAGLTASLAFFTRLLINRQKPTEKSEDKNNIDER